MTLNLEISAVIDAATKMTCLRHVQRTLDRSHPARICLVTSSVQIILPEIGKQKDSAI